MMTRYFFDSYAIVEILKGNMNYAPYIDSDIVINKFILTELCYHWLREYGKRVAFGYVDEYSCFIQSTRTEIIKKAMEFRYKNKKRKLSMADSIGYVMARDLGIKFLTGDVQFRDMDNVEYVK